MYKATVSDVLGIRYPIIQGGLAYVANGELAAAVSQAGGFGQVGAAGRTPEAFRSQIRLAKSLTDQPLGANIPVSRYQDHSAYVEVALAEASGLTAVSLSAGDPRPFVPSFKDAGLKVMLVVSTVRQAIRAEEIGGDIVICEGFEAGGHDGPAELTVLSLIPQVVRRIHTPVVAAGGIATGEQMAAALLLGASGVQMGTRFVATVECEAHENYKDSLVQASDDGTVVVERSLGVSTRLLRNDYALLALETEQRSPGSIELRETMSGERNRKAAIDGQVAEGYMYAGQGVGLISEVLTVREVMDRMIQETKDTMSRAQETMKIL